MPELMWYHNDERERERERDLCTLTQVTSSMTQLRDMENNHHEKVTELAVTRLEQMAKNQLEEELHDDLKVVSKRVHNYINTLLI